MALWDLCSPIVLKAIRIQAAFGMFLGLIRFPWEVLASFFSFNRLRVELARREFKLEFLGWREVSSSALDCRGVSLINKFWTTFFCCLNEDLNRSFPCDPWNPFLPSTLG